MNAKKIMTALCTALLLLAGCNSIEDIKHLSKEQMQRYVQARIGEEVKLISVDGDISGNGSVEYVFNTVDRNIEFEVYAFKYVSGIDGMRIGNYRLEIWIRYESGVLAHYQEESAALAEKHQIDYKLRESQSKPTFISGATITVGSYDDIEKLTDFIIELDRLYAFQVKSKYGTVLNVGRIIFSVSSCSFIGPDFSRSGIVRLHRESIKNQITMKYVLALKSEGRTDSQIPQDVWDKYNPPSNS